jgi:hypothetical protein
MDIATHIAAATERLIASGKIEEAIERQLTKTIESIVEQELRSYSDFGKALHAQVTKALALDPAKLTLPSYNQVVVDVVRRAMDAHIGTVGKTHLEQLMGELLKAPPAEIKLSELVAEYRKHIASRGRRDRIGSRIGLTVAREKFSADIMLAPEPVSEKYKHDYTLHVFSFDKDAPATVSTIWVGAQQFSRDFRLFVGDVFGFERTLFQLWAAKTPIVLDEDECDLEIGEEDGEW